MLARKWYVLLAVIVLAGMVLIGWSLRKPQVVEKVVTRVVTQEVGIVVTRIVEKEKIVEKPVDKIVEKPVPAEAYTTPHPILSDLRVRQAIAFCIDRDAAIASVYPYVTDKAALRMDAGVPKAHWAWGGPYEDYAYNPEKARSLLDQAGWKQKDGQDYRSNEKGETLAIKLVTTDAQFRQTWAAVIEQNLKGCGIQLVREHVPYTWLFGESTGLQRRDFELAAYAWVGQADPQGRTLYACDQIPLPSNNWSGQNIMGWCNNEASAAIVQATNTLDRLTRENAYDTVWKDLMADMVSLPMFQRAETEAWSKNLDGLKVDPTEYTTASAAAWTLKDNTNTVAIGMSQEPSSMWSLVSSSAAGVQIGQMGIGIGNTQYNYDYQAVLQDGLSTIESGKARNEQVDVRPGDMVFNISGKAVKLESGTKVVVDGKTTEYDGSGALKLPQLVVTYKLKPYTWSDGTAGSEEDIKLAYKINCDKEAKALSYSTCDEIQKVDFGANLEWTVTYWPGVQDPTYMVMPFSLIPNNPIYPSHQVLKDGRKLADVPAREWSTLPEITEKPLSYGPWVISEWVKGQHIKLVTNPSYKPAPAIKEVTVQFLDDTNRAVAQLLSGDLDYLERAMLGGGAEVQTVVDAAKQGKANIQIVPSPTGEHIDFNLFAR